VVDDDPVVCAHLTTILGSAPDLDVVGVAHDGAEAVEGVLRWQPDVVLMDLRMPGVDGITAIEQLSRLVGPPRTIALTTFDADQYVMRALSAGAAGFLVKGTAPDELLKAVRSTAAGSSVLSPIALQRLVASSHAQAEAELGTRRRARALLDHLTEREVEIVVCLGRGRSNAEIARELNLSANTVKGYVSRVMAKLACENRTQVGLIAYDAGLVSKVD
jgi:DNA-binding NarL/FixJ family response regulator